jgi:hypothetical protein
MSKKTFAVAIALFLMLTIAVTLVALPITYAHDPPWTFPTTAYVTCAPGTVGVGQYTTIVCWLDRYSPTSGGAEGQVWEGFKLTITKPDGTTDIIGPFTCSSATASDYKVYAPQQVGKYTIVFSWPGGVVESTEAILPRTQANALAGIGDIFLGATSEPATLIVQDEPIKNWPEPPLPADYWTRPINAMNRGWTTIASNWLKGTWLIDNWQNEGTAPDSAHVLWTAPIGAKSPSSAGYHGGIADAAWPGEKYNINDYVAAWSQPIIMDGVIYYNAPQTAEGCHYGYYAVDLHTGEQIWYKNGTDNGLNNPYTIGMPGGEVGGSYTENFASLSNGQVLRIHTVNGEGIASFLWMRQGSTWYMLDPSTGNLILTIKNVPSGTASTDQDGSLLIYNYNAATGRLLCWNSTQVIYAGGPVGSPQQSFHPAVGAVIDAVNDIAWMNASTTWGAGYDDYIKAALNKPHSGYTMNVTMPAGLSGSMTILRDINRVPKQIFGAALKTNFGTMGSIGGAVIDDNIRIWLATINEHATDYSPFPNLPASVNTNLGFTVSMEYDKTITVPVPNKNYTWSIGPVSYDSKVFFLSCQQLAQKWCYSLTTGNLLWGPTVSTAPMGYFASGGGMGSVGGVYDGIFVAANGHNFNGQIFAYNATTGKQLWNYNATTTYPYESAYGDNMPLNMAFVADGKVFFVSSEHSPTQPLWRESYLRCLNLTDGTEIWKLEQYSTGVVQAVADGYIVSNSQFDNLIYCIGKGPSGTTVSAPQTIPTLGSGVVITGSVTDQSPGALVYAKKYGCLNGVACVSDASQASWMQYLYMQQTYPSDADGVEVVLETLDPNGNFYEIGRTTTDLNGNYGFAFTPEVPGTYQIIATFEGSASYGSSKATTYIHVAEAPAATPEPTPAPASMADIYIVPGIVGIIIAIAVVGIVMMLMLRKR